MNRYCLLSTVIASALVAACATPETQTSAESHPDKVYTTGSRIPVRDGTGSGSVKSITNKEGVDDMMQKRGETAPGKAGGM